MSEDEQIAKAKANLAAKSPKARPSPEEIANRRAAAAAKLLEAERAVEERDELLEMEAEEILADLAVSEGKSRVVMIKTPAGPVVLSRGPEAAFKSFMSACEAAGKNKTVPDSVFRKFVYPTVRYPASAEEFFTESPATLYFCADQLVKLYGAKREEDAGK